MSSKGYGLFCPLAMACEVIEPRWTMLILLEMGSGATRFNEIRRGVPGISPTLLSKRLKEMSRQGLVERLEDKAKGTVDYLRTPMAVELEPTLRLLGEWAYRNTEAGLALEDTNPDYLMWNVRRKINTSALPDRRTVVRYHFTDLKKNEAIYWLYAKPGAAVELCMTDPGFDIDLFIETDSKTLAAIWMGYTSWQEEETREKVFLSGDVRLIKTIDDWMVRSSYGSVM